MEFFDANKYFLDRFGSKTYKAAVSLDVTCPNRDGTKGTRGCIFCSEGGSGEFSERNGTVTERIDEAISRVRKKAGPNAVFICYFQSFTNTYCSAEYLSSALREALRHPDIVAISIATRPDCLPDDILKVISEANEVKPVFVELGLQTMHEETAKWIRRGYETSVYDEAVRKLHERDINVITHLIFGLKGESREMMLQSVKHACDAGTDGVKFTSLYVLKGTDLEQEYLTGELTLPDREEYFDIVSDALKILPTGTVVHRLTGDGPRRLLLAPLWTIDKRSNVNYINKRFKS